MIRIQSAIKSLFIAILISIFLANGAQAADPIRNYQIDVVSIANGKLTMEVTEEMSRQIIAKVNQAFDDATGGQIRFTFRKLHPVNYSDLITVQSSDIQKVTGLTPEADPGFDGAILVGVIAYSSASPFAGQASNNNYVLMNGNWNLDGAWVLTHELGHNLGLMHANSAVCTNQLPITCEQKEYGDSTSTMGNYIYSHVSSPMVSRFSATELDKLKVLPTESRAIAAESGDYKLAPAYSKGINLPKVLYIPIGSELTYSVEYRPVIGNDSTLSQTQIYIPGGGGSYYNNIPSGGLQLRILRTVGTQFKDLQPVLTNFTNLETALVVPTLTGDQTQPIGKVFTLSDGSTLTFVSADPNTGATVRVQRSPDKEAPIALSVKPNWRAGVNSFNNLGERLIFKKNIDTWDYPEIQIPLSAVTDNRLVKTIQIEVNGEIVGQVDTPSLNGVKNYSYQTTKAGTFTFRLIATDYAGLSTATEPSSLVTAYKKITLPFVQISSGKDATNSVVVTVNPVNKGAHYILSNLSSGKIVTTVEKNGRFEFTIIELARNQKFTARLLGSDDVGYVDDGSDVTYEPAKTECTNTQCFSGYQWNVNTGYWVPGVGNLTLQEQVAGKWVNIQTAKPVTDPNGTMKKYVTFVMKVTYQTTGKHTYRLSLAASKKYSGKIMPTFTQLVSAP